jgi:RNA polymerase sigma-70 factor, ECF subfamily
MESDSDLLIACQNGDESALRELYRRYSRAVFSWSLRVLQSRQGAESATQAVFEKAWRTAGKRDPRVPVATWLFGLACQTTGDSAPDPDLYAVWLGGQAASHLAGLPLREAETLRLLHHERRSIEEAARILGVSESEVRRLSFEGLAALKEALEHQRVMEPDAGWPPGPRAGQ